MPERSIHQHIRVSPSSLSFSRPARVLVALAGATMYLRTAFLITFIIHFKAYTSTFFEHRSIDDKHSIKPWTFRSKFLRTVDGEVQRSTRHNRANRRHISVPLLPDFFLQFLRASIELHRARAVEPNTDEHPNSPIGGLDDFQLTALSAVLYLLHMPIPVLPVDEHRRRRSVVAPIPIHRRARKSGVRPLTAFVFRQVFP